MKRILKNTLSILNDAEKKKLVALILLNVLISIVDIASLVLLVVIITFYTNGDPQVRYLSHFQWLFDKNSILPVTIFLILFILKSVFGYWVLAVQYNYVYKVASRISKFNLMKYLEGDFQDFVHVDSSVKVRQITDQPIQFCHYILAGIQQIITECILSFFTVIVILIFNAKLFLLLALCLLPPLFLVAWITKRKLKNARVHAKSSSEKSLQRLHEALGGYIESNIYGREQFFTDRFSEYQEQMSKYLADIQTTQGVPARLIETFAVFGLFILVIAGRYTGNAGAVEIINIGAFMAAAYKIIPGIVKISNISGQIKTYEFTIDDLVKHKYEKRELGNNTRRGLGNIVFDNVTFSHKSHSVLSDFVFEIHSGEFLGISGPSGNGKTTFVNLLLGFLKEQSGDILFDAIRVTDKERQQYWNGVAYVQQRPFLIYDTLKTNITLSDETVNNEKLREVARATGLEELVSQSREGINMMITEHGKNISGGQRQRIAIARALYKDADLIILDEPFSELDARSERQILEYLSVLAARGKMIILITHKKENLSYCSKTYQIG